MIVESQAERRCAYGNHRNRITWCRHPEIAKSRRAVTRSRAFCEQCPLFVASATERVVPRPLRLQEMRCCHLGQVTETIQRSCCSSISVRECALHGECVATPDDWDAVRGERARANDVRRVKCCTKCDDHFPIPLSSLAIVAVHFNPLGWVRPLANFHRWKSQLGRLEECLRVVELTFDGRPSTDADIVITGDLSRHFLFQKEALVNLAVKRLPPEIEYVIWSDQDLMFQNPDWAKVGVAILQSGQADFVQLFDEVRFLDKQGEYTRSNDGSAKLWLSEGKSGGSPGGAWIARREMFEAIGGLYPYNLTGGGDVPFFDAVSGANWDYYYKCISDEMRAHQQRWIDHARSVTTRGVSFVPGAVDHLYHGSRENRRYVQRTQLLSEFDPETDVTMEESGLIAFTDANPALREGIADYFAARLEDV